METRLIGRIKVLPNIKEFIFKERGKNIMRKSKKIMALLLSLSMCATCFTACGGSSDDASSTASESVDKQAVNNGGDVKVDLSNIDSVIASVDGVDKPEELDNDSSAEKVQLTVWGPTEEQTILKQLCEAFDKSRADFDIEFKYAAVPENDAATTVKGDPQASADVFYFAGDQLASLVEAGYISEINETIANEVKEQHIEEAVASCTRDGKLYAIPFTANLWYMFYNKSMYTAQEVESLDTMFAKDFGKNDKGEQIYNFSIDIANGWYIGAFFYAGGCTIYGPNGDDPTQCDWAEEKGIQVVDYISKLVDTGKFYKDAQADSIGKLEDGTLAAFCTGSWNALAIKQKLGDNYAATVAPKINTGSAEDYLKPFADYKMIAVNSLCKNQKAAQLLAQFLANPYSQMVRIQAREVQPTSKVLVESKDLDFATTYPAVAASLAQLEHTVNRPSTSQIDSYWKPAEALGGCIYNKKETVRDENRAAYIKEKIVAKIVKH